MKPEGRVKVGIVGSQFRADIHAESFRLMPDEAEVVAGWKTASRSMAKTAAWSKRPCTLAITPRLWVLRSPFFSAPPA
ncbi:MAG: hypothetical protein FJ387_05870 [Verrucomicrobia bacterium]|nr:hypothetical protein [Verrucomicrobiota bacterium]